MPGTANGPDDGLMWDAVNWAVHGQNVARLRRRIFTAVRDGDWPKARNLQKLMLRSWSNTLISVRQVTQRNAGRRTAGIDRVVADRPFYSGKHKKHGMNLQVIANPDGDIVWVSGALPGAVHDKKAEWVRREVAHDERVRRLEGWSMRIGGVAPG